MDEANRYSRRRSLPSAHRPATAFLRVALPPSNVSADLAKTQAAVFRRLAEPAARALPPLVPFGWTDRPEDVEAVPDSMLPGGLHCGEYALVGNTLVVSVEWRREADRPSSAAFNDGGELLFPAGSHVVIAPLEGRYRLEGRTLETLPPARSLTLPEPPRGTAHVYRLASMEVSWQRAERGLEYLRYEVLSQRWLTERLD